MHDRDHAQDKAPDTTPAERATAAAPQVPAALALQRKIGNRAFGQLISRATPEESVELLDPAINGAHVDAEQISRVFLPLSKDQEGFDKMAEAYCRDRGMVFSMSQGLETPERLEARAAVMAALRELMDRAIAQGAMRPDAEPADLKVLLSGIASSLTGAQERDPAVWRRYAQLVADAFRA